MVKNSKTKLIAKLQQKAHALGRIPKVTDIKADPDMPPYNQYYMVFNSWNAALKAAGMSTNVDLYTNSQLIAILQQKAKALGRTPRVADMVEDTSLPSYATYQNRFGTWNNALEVAGLYVNKTHHSRQQGIQLLQQKAEELGRSPKSTEVDLDIDMPPSSSYIKIYGRWNNALKAAGLEPIRKVAQ